MEVTLDTSPVNLHSILCETHPCTNEGLTQLGEGLRFTVRMTNFEACFYKIVHKYENSLLTCPTGLLTSV